MGEAENLMPKTNGGFTAEQLDSLAKLLERSVTRGSVSWLATSVLGTPAEKAVGKTVSADDFVRRILQVLNEQGKIPEAIRKLREKTFANTRLMVALKRLMNGED